MQYLYRVKNPTTGQYLSNFGEKLPNGGNQSILKQFAWEYPKKEAQKKARVFTPEGFTEIERAGRVPKPPIKTIVITVEGGVIQAIERIPKGVRVRVLDFDTDGADEERLTTVNKEGEKAVVSIWENQ